jgi:competence protein CoiA
MKYALVNGVKTTPKKGINGHCQLCSAEVVAKCGDIKVHHWAHKSNIECDHWWETETPWHRNWKNCFPLEWQEIIHKDSNGEKHIADVKTPDGLVVEFQHSFITKEERDARESFYEHMIWIVDGTRRKTDLRKFNSGTKFFKRTPIPNVFFVPYPEEVLQKNWLGSKEIVILDFNGDSPNPNTHLYMFWRPKGRPLMRCMLLVKSDIVGFIRSGELIDNIKSMQG